MARTSATTNRTATAAPHVAVIGGGIAGLTAALKLSQCGFRVTVYEATDTLGGNLSSEEVRGVYHDVYPHMFCSWYYNFWQLFEKDLNLSRADNFTPHNGVQLRKKDWPDYRELENASTVRSILANLKSGVLSPAELFLVGFSMLDLASRSFNRDSTDQIDRLDVNGFLYSRGYATESVAKLQNYILETIWSIRSDVTAATSYQDFIKNMCSFPHPTPYAWLLESSIAEKIIKPLEAKLSNCTIRRGAKVTSVEILGGKPSITIEPSTPNTGAAAPETADYVVLAVPGEVLATLVMTGAKGSRIVDALPKLSELQHAHGVAIPVVDLYLNKKLEGIPKEPVGFLDSSYALTMIDISQLWTDDPNMKDRTALVLAASDGDAIPSLDWRERGHLMIKHLLEYLPKGSFNPGGHWGDPTSDIDWNKSHYRSNDGNKLFINDVGSCEWRPRTTYEKVLPNVFFAGDFCKTDVDMATIEVAVQSGVLAAKAVQARELDVSHRQMGDPITDIKHDAEYGAATFLAGKLVMLPFAYAAAVWAMAVDATRRKDSPGRKMIVVPPVSYSSSTAPLLLPLAYVQDWWETSYWLAQTIASDLTKPGPDEPASEQDGATLGGVLANIAGHALVGLGDCLQGISNRQPSRGDPAAGSNLGGALSAFTGQVINATLAALAATPPAGVDPASPERPPRRGRIKTIDRD